MAEHVSRAEPAPAARAALPEVEFKSTYHGTLTTRKARGIINLWHMGEDGWKDLDIYHLALDLLNALDAPSSGVPALRIAALGLLHEVNWLIQTHPSVLALNPKPCLESAVRELRIALIESYREENESPPARPAPGVGEGVGLELIHRIHHDWHNGGSKCDQFELAAKYMTVVERCEYIVNALADRPPPSPAGAVAAMELEAVKLVRRMASTRYRHTQDSSRQADYAEARRLVAAAEGEQK